jgi:hypothetical protein
LHQSSPHPLETADELGLRQVLRHIGDAQSGERRIEHLGSVVVEAVDGLPDDQAVGEAPVVVPTDVNGNHVVEDIGGRYITYDHLKPGPVRVTAGARLKLGEMAVSACRA